MAKRNQRTMLTKEYFTNYWINRLTNIVVNMFKWKNLPKEINVSAMEKAIMLGGYAIFFKDKELDSYFALNGALTGVDVYGYPTTMKPISLASDIRFPELKANKDGVIIYANRTRTSAMEYIIEYADKLSEIDLAIKLNTMAMKHPIIMKGTEETKMSFETLMHQYEETYYQIIIDKNLSLDSSVEALNLKVDAQEILNLQKEKETVLNEFFNMFGVSGSVEKRERMISGEMNAMMQQIGVQRNIWLGVRQEACEKINELYGINLSVDFNEVNFADETQNPNEPKPQEMEEEPNE